MYINPTIQHFAAKYALDSAEQLRDAHVAELIKMRERFTELQKQVSVLELEIKEYEILTAATNRAWMKSLRRLNRLERKYPGMYGHQITNQC